MTKYFLGFFWSLFGLAPLHNFYVSTTSVRYVPNENSFQITTQVFLDDFESALRLYGNENISLTPDGSQVKIDSLIEDYFRKNIIFSAKGEKMNFDFLGKVYKIDVLVAYMELKMDTIVSPLSIKNTILFDYLSDQKNIIHLKLASKRKSFLAVSSKSIFEIPKDFFDF
tara:strand:- start:6101 stop:6607 length:507 start_codon:yes stop_codon:yes gene_type:complete